MLGVDHASSSEPQPPLNLASIRSGQGESLHHDLLTRLLAAAQVPRFNRRVGVAAILERGMRRLDLRTVLQICQPSAPDLIPIRLFAAVSS